MNTKEKLTELCDTGEALIMLGEAIRNHARRGNMDESIKSLAAAKVCARELVTECALNIGVDLP